MTLQEKINDDMKTAMKAKNTVALTVTRGIKTAIMNALVASGKTPQDSLDDEAVLEVITRTAKQRKDAINQFTEAGRDDLAAEDKAELEVLQQYLPEMMSAEAVMEIVKAKAAELGVSEKKDMGHLMGTVMAELKGKAEGDVVKNAVDSVLS